MASLSMDSRQQIERFLRTFQPSALAELDSIAESYAGLSGLALTDKLEEAYIGKRFIRLNQQKQVHFPEQRSKEWFAERKKVKGTITGSRPSGWFFGLKDKDSYEEQLAYIHYGKKQVFDKEALARMRWGVQYEDTAALRFLEWSLRNGIDACIFETGFQRNRTYEHLGASPDGLVSITYTGTVIGHREKADGEEEVLMAYYDLCMDRKTIVVSGLEKIEKGLLHQPMTGSYKPCTADGIDLTGWSTTSDLIGQRISSVAHSILEIKCPQKMYSSIPNYYLVQLHMEMSAYNLKETFFVCWSQKDGKERTRVWKLNYNAGFFDTFVNDIVELFRAPRGNERYGTEWETFRQHWFDFKRTFSSVKTWEPYLTKFFDTRKYSLEKAFKDKKTKGDEE